MGASRHTSSPPTWYRQAAIVLVSVPLFAATGSALGKPCAARQIVSVSEASEWRCEVSLAPRQAILVRADQRSLDVTLATIPPGKTAETVIDAPTKRTTPELMLLGPVAAAVSAVVIVRSTDTERVRRDVAVSVETVSGGETDPLVRGLYLLTSSALKEVDASSQKLNQRILDLRTAAARFREARANDLAADALLRIAYLRYWSTDWAGAAQEARDAMDAFAAIPDQVMQSQAAVVRAAALIESAGVVKSQGRRGSEGTAVSRFDEPMKLLAAAAEEFHAAGLRYDEAQAINYLGVGYGYQQDSRAARAKFDQAGRIYADLGDRASGALPLQNVGMIDYQAGDYARAVDSFNLALSVSDRDRDGIHYVAMLLNRGIALYVLGDFDSAMRSFLEGLKISREIGSAQEEARSLYSLGMVYLLIGDREQAGVLLERSLALRRPLLGKDTRGLHSSLLQVGNLRRDSGDLPGALKLHVEALERAMTLSQKARALDAIGLDYEAKGAAQSAMQTYKSGLELELQEDSPEMVLLASGYGRAQLLSGDEAGRTSIVEAAELHRRHGDDNLAAQSYLFLARHDLHLGHLQAALTNVEKALSLYRSEHLGAVNPDLRATYMASRSATFELQAHLYMMLARRADTPVERARLEQLALMTNETSRQEVLDDFRELASPANGSPGATDVLALDSQIAAKRHRLDVSIESGAPSRAIQSLRDDISLLRASLDVAQSQSRTSARVAASRRAKPEASLRAIQDSLSADAAIVAYQLGEESSWVWCVTRQGIVPFPLRERADVESAAHELYSLWSTPVQAPDAFERELIASRTLLGPVTAALRGKKTITIVAEGALRMLPFGAVWIETTAGAPTRLAETHAVTFRPALTPSVPTSTARSGGNRILLVGDPAIAAPQPGEGFAGDPWSLQPLPGSRREVESIADIASQWTNDMLLGAGATKPALMSLPLDTYRAIHFATHARLDLHDPQLSSIALSTRDAGTLGSSLTVREIVGFRLHAETVVLSACEASRGKDYRGQLSFGLSEAFLLAGARNVLGSLWRVSDDAAQVYMKHFYEEYVRHDATPVAAAQAAARAMSRDPAYRNPYFWAGFVVTQR